MTYTKHTEHVMGTVVSIDVKFAAGAEPLASLALASACESLHQADGVFSTWQPDSPISRLRHGRASADDVPQEVLDVLTECRCVRDLSGGWFDPWAMPGGVDPTGYVKGWAAQRVLDVLRNFGALAAMVNAGGDVAAFGRPRPDRPWRLALRDPRTTDTNLGVVPLEDAALAVSGTYERGDHITDPRTGRAATAGVLSAAVVGPDLGMADALATGLVAGGATAARSFEEIPAYAGWYMLVDGTENRLGDFPLAAA
jgi:thiamine biosynthesis lipoprotein